MMISPEGYYEEYLKGKTAPQIMTAIRGLKKGNWSSQEYNGTPGLWERICHASE